MNSRDRILKRLRETKYIKKDVALPTVSDEQTFADYPLSRDKLLSCFKKQFIDLNGEIYIIPNLKEAADKTFEIINTLPEKTCLIQSTPFLEEIYSKNELLLRFVEEDLSMDSKVFAKYEVGITAADVLVARTGSILISSLFGGGRRLSVLPPIHMVIAREEQIVYSLEQAIQNFAQDKAFGSYATIITGPSRTSDIEKQLVLGAHGPKRLILILIADSS